jgi:hypothetical protein
LAASFDDSAVKVDQSVHNAARITKIVGTVSAKGDHAPDLGRVWRLATGTMAAEGACVELQRLEALASTAPSASQPSPVRPPAPPAGGQTSIESFLDAHGVGFKVKATSYATVYALVRCLTSDDHEDGAAFLVFPSGVWHYKCLHDRCSDKTTQQALAALQGAEEAPPAYQAHPASAAAWEDPASEEDARREADAARESAPLAWLQRHPVFKGMAIVGARKLGREGGRFELILAGGRVIPLGTAADLLNPQRAQAAIADAVGIAIPDYKRKDWRLVASAILMLAGAGEDIGSDPSSEMKAWLAAYIEREADGHSTEAVERTDSILLAARLMAMGGHAPHTATFRTTDGRLVVYVEKLLQWLTSKSYGVRTSGEEVRLRLTKLGFSRERWYARWDREAMAERRLWNPSASRGQDSGVTRRWVYVSPVGFDPTE